MYINFFILLLYKKDMEQIHAHEVLHMMDGSSYTELSLKEAIVERFGEEQRFYACSSDNMDADKLIEFLKKRSMKSNGKEIGSYKTLFLLYCFKLLVLIIVGNRDLWS